MYSARDSLLCFKNLKNKDCAESLCNLKSLEAMLSAPITFYPAYLHVLRVFAS
jgi:hypothetical protein